MLGCIRSDHKVVITVLADESLIMVMRVCNLLSNSEALI